MSRPHYSRGSVLQPNNVIILAMMNSEPSKRRPGLAHCAFADLQLKTASSLKVRNS